LKVSDIIDKDVLEKAFTAARNVGGTWLTMEAVERAILAYLTAMEAKRRTPEEVAESVLRQKTNVLLDIALHFQERTLLGRAQFRSYCLHHGIEIPAAIKADREGR
jgi:hypothetical protein